MNLDIGGQMNRDDQGGKWKIVDLHDGADFQFNLETSDFPMESNSVHNIYTSHCLEHLEPDKLRRVFSEMYRVSINGAKVRVVVPSFLKGVFYYFFSPRVLKRKMMPRINSNTPDTKMSRLSSWFYTEVNKQNGTPGHKTTWDFQLMKTYLQEAGFKHIKKRSLKRCSKVFVGKDNPKYNAFSMYVEAQKIIGDGSKKETENSRVEQVIPKQVIDLMLPFNFKSMYELGNKKTDGVPYSVYYQTKGIEYTSIDLNGLDGAISLDLNNDIDLTPREMVANIGTSEHVSSQRAVFQNIHNLSSGRMVHWVPLALKHPEHGFYGYTEDFFVRLGKLNNYEIEKLYIEKTFKKWSLICCSYRKNSKTTPFVWDEDLPLTKNEGGSGGVAYE